MSVTVGRLVPLLLVLSSGCGGGSSTDVALDKPERGFQLSVAPFAIVAGSEVQDCYFFKAPIDRAMDIHRITVAMNSGSHHMNLFRLTGSPGGHFDGEVQHGCWDAVAFESWALFYNTQNYGQTDWTLPTGVVEHVEPNDLFMIQTHYVNADTQKTELGRGKVLINFYEAPPSVQPVRLGSMFANNRAIRLPPHEPSSFTTTCIVPQNVTFVSVAGHFHSRGREFTVGTVTDALGSNYKEIYKSTNWDDPPRGTYDPGHFCPAGGGLQYTCKFFNDTDGAIRFGPQVEFEEHCNVFAYYYPALESGRPIYCF